MNCSLCDCLHHNIWPPQRLETPWGGDSALRFRHSRCLRNIAERKKEPRKDWMKHLHFQPEAFPPALSPLSNSTQEPLFADFRAALATTRSHCIMSTVVLSGGGSWVYALGESSCCRSTYSPRSPKLLPHTSLRWLWRCAVIACLCAGSLPHQSSSSLTRPWTPQARTDLETCASHQHPGPSWSAEVLRKPLLEKQFH